MLLGESAKRDERALEDDGPDDDVLQSGLGFGLDHTAHNLMGFAILVLTQVATVGIPGRPRPSRRVFAGAGQGR